MLEVVLPAVKVLISSFVVYEWIPRNSLVVIERKEIGQRKEEKRVGKRTLNDKAKKR